MQLVKNDSKKILVKDKFFKDENNIKYNLETKKGYLIQYY